MTAIRKFAAVAMASLSAIVAASADGKVAYPTRAVKIVVPTSAGGAPDIVARVIGGKLAGEWNQPVVIENRPGANSILGTSVVAKAPADGYTLVLSVDSTMTMQPHLKRNLSYDPIKDFAHIATIADGLVVVLANDNHPLNDFSDVISAAKQTPNKLTVGVGTMTTQMILERLSLLTGIKVVKVPFKGGAEGC